MVHEQKFKDLLSSTCQVSVERIVLDLESKAMRGQCSIPTGGNILSLEFFLFSRSKDENATIGISMRMWKTLLPFNGRNTQKPCHMVWWWRRLIVGWGGGGRWGFREQYTSASGWHGVPCWNTPAIHSSFSIIRYFPAKSRFGRILSKINSAQECFPVGCVPAAHWPYAGVCSRGGAWSGGVPGPEGPGPGGGVCSQGGVLPGRGGLLPGGGVLPGRGDSPWQRGFSLPGGVPPCPETPRVNRITDTCKNITLATTSLRPVKMWESNPQP